MSELGMSDETLSIEGLMEDAPGTEVSAGAPAFLDHFTDEATRGYMERKGFKDVQALGASFASLERMMSSGRVPLPSGEDDADGYARAFSALGRPETAAEYGFGELAGADPEFSERAAEWLFEAGVGKAIELLGKELDVGGTYLDRSIVRETIFRFK